MTGLEFFAYALISGAISIALTMITAPKPKNPTPGQLDVPTAEEGAIIPVCFGTNIIKQSNVVWYGDPSVAEIRAKGGKK